MERKAFPFEMKSLNEMGVFEGYAAVFNNVDSGGDVIAPGAFAKTIQERSKRVKITWQHDWREPIGKPLILREDDRGLYVKGQLVLDTQRGREAYALMKEGVIDELSIGYDTIKQEFEERDGKGSVRVLKELRLYEISPVTVAMNPEARVLSVKAAIPYRRTPKAPEDEAWDAAQEVAEASVEDLKVMCAWYDASNPDVKSSYKLPHHRARAPHAVVWRGVAAAMAALMGARGGVQIPEQDRRAVYNHLAQHYEDFDREPPTFKAVEEIIEALCTPGERKAAEPRGSVLTAQALRARALEIELNLQRLNAEVKENG